MQNITNSLREVYSQWTSNPQVFWVSALIFSVYLSVINEEIIVAVCFLVAVYYIHYAISDSIAETLNDRASSIAKDLTKSQDLVFSNLELQIAHEQKFQDSVQNMQQVHSYIREQLSSINSIDNALVVEAFTNQIKKKLRALRDIKQTTGSLVKATVQTQLKSNCELQIYGHIKVTQNYDLIHSRLIDHE